MLYIVYIVLYIPFTNTLFWIPEINERKKCVISKVYPVYSEIVLKSIYRMDFDKTASNAVLPYFISLVQHTHAIS